MTSRRKRSKRRCGGNGRRRRRPNPTFLIDHCLGGRALAATLAEQGCPKTHRLSDLFAPDEEDHVWLRHAGQQRWVVLTKDRMFRRRPLELHAVYDTKARVFVLVGKALSGAEQVAAFTRALPRILRRCHQAGPFIATVTPTGFVSMATKTQLRKWLGRAEFNELA